MRDEAVKAVETYLQGLRNKDLSRVPFARDVTFESPLSPELTGAGAVIQFLVDLFPDIRDVVVKQHIVEGEYVATLFDLHTTFGLIPVFDCFRIVAGQIKQIRAYYDPRPITNRR